MGRIEDAQIPKLCPKHIRNLVAIRCSFTDRLTSNNLVKPRDKASIPRISDARATSTTSQQVAQSL